MLTGIKVYCVQPLHDGLLLPLPYVLPTVPPSPPIVAIPPSPFPDGFVDFTPRHSIPDQPHGHSQGFNIPISNLVIKEQHVLVGHARLLLDLVEVSTLVSRKDLEVVKVVVCALGSR